MIDSFFSFFTKQPYNDLIDNMPIGISMNNDISKEKYIHQNFDLVIVEHGYESPYIFKNYFKKNMDFTKFAYNITDLMRYYIMTQEKEYLKTYFGEKKIKNIYTISKMINRKMFPSFIDNIIIIKRIEFLSDYIVKQNFEDKYIDYVNTILDDLYKGRQYLLENITKIPRY